MAATLLVGTGVIGASIVGGRLIAPNPSPTAPVAVVNPSASPSPRSSASVVPYRAPSWTATGTAAPSLDGGTATLLLDGKVLVENNPGSFRPAVVELYDPGTGSWTATGSMRDARVGHSATLLPDGKVLVAGGRSTTSQRLLASAELYDPGTGSWTPTGSMGTPRQGHRATLLPDGNVLVAGGMNDEPNANHPSLASAELYDPGTGSWTPTGSMGTRRASAPAVLLPDGRVLVVGGDDFGTDTLASAELYDPSTGSWAATGSMHEVRARHILIVLPDGRVLVAGGVDTVVNSGPLASAELYDPGTGSWTATGSMTAPRTYPIAALLPDGNVLVAGGGLGGSGGPDLGQAASAELYDPGSGTWIRTANMINNGTSAALLLDGRVLVVGGGSNGTSAELYDPGSGIAPTSSTSGSPSPSAAASAAQSPAAEACGNPGAPAGSASATPAWTLTRSMTTPRSQHTATLLRDGKVLVEGGDAARRVGLSLVPPVSAELYDPATGTWTATGNLTTARGGQTATLLPDGKVLVAGGSGFLSDRLLASAELYDPATGTWAATGNMVTGRKYHTATLLPDGKVLVAGGFGNGANGEMLSSAELYDPATGTWAATGGMTQPRVYHKATLLRDGRVLVTSGPNGNESGPAAGDLYDPASGTWTATRKMLSPGQTDSATLLPDGKVLVTGGSNDTSAVLFDPRNGTWTATGSMHTHRRSQTATLLANGTVLVTGGEYETTGPCTSAELYDPASGTWTATWNLIAPRFTNFTAILLADGRVLVAGGNDYGNGILDSAELYDPGDH